MKHLVASGGQVVLVDDEDYEWLSKLRWRVDSRGYAVRTSKHPHDPRRKTQEQMHRAVMGLAYGDGREVDHRNGNPLDNRRENLRICSRSQNQMNRSLQKNNRSGYKGVSWDSRRRRWSVYIGINGKNRFVGSFDTPEDGYRAYCAAAEKLHKDFHNNGLVNPQGVEYTPQQMTESA
ncbi:HNH endonuclease [Burkholderia multivorans]|nr:HNH endonuclease [Burkholderia multivorans]